MASYRTFDLNALRKGAVLVGGLLLTDASGDVLNASPPPATTNQYGDPLVLPGGLSAAARLSSGLYRLTLEQPWHGLLGLSAMAINPLKSQRATIVGTVDLNGLTLSTLNGLTLQTDADVGANYTTTFTTPTSIADIAAQINAGNAGTSVLADILTSVTGAKYLRVISTTISSASTLAIAAASTGDGTLGMSNTTATATGPGLITLVGYNTRAASTAAALTSGTDVDYQPIQTVDLLHSIAGVGTALLSGGIAFDLWLNNLQAQ